MNTLDKYKKEMRNMFFLSVDKDISEWTHSNCYMYSPDYNIDDTKNCQTKLKINKQDCELSILNNFFDIFICKYKKFFITDYKVYIYVKKLQRYEKKIEEDSKVQIEINAIKDGLNSIQSYYKKDVRKQKLNKLK